MTDEFDVVVAGLGGMGSAILAECARRGAKALGIDRHAEGHGLGSSSGKSRLFRKAYFEDERYIPLLHRAEVRWRELEKESGRTLLRRTGLLLAGAESSDVLKRAGAAAARHGIALETLTSAETCQRWPALKLRKSEIAIFEPEAGVLDPEGAIAAQLQCADEKGALLRHETPLTSWSEQRNEIAVSLGDGSEVRAQKLILALGPWFSAEMERAGVPLQIQRNVQAWFSPASSSYDAVRFPAFLIDRPELPANLYGFPDFGEGVKAAFHGSGEITLPASLVREIDPVRDLDPLRAALDDWMPGAAGRFLEGKVCMYSLTSDQNFVVDRHPESANVILCGGFSGHGFKFAPVIGEIAAGLALDQQRDEAAEFLTLKRFSRQ